MANVILHLVDQGDEFVLKFHSDPKVEVDTDPTPAQYFGLLAVDFISNKTKELEEAADGKAKQN